jgi:hypothetical protein
VAADVGVGGGVIEGIALKDVVNGVSGAGSQPDCVLAAEFREVGRGRRVSSPVRAPLPPAVMVIFLADCWDNMLCGIGAMLTDSSLHLLA